ncbi:uncharacterized protein [Dermacentor albipictus]|uniref:uncharacterized protein n=1 Tax=Dermacentor albipictus TaxID=60249 RepID=UPI0038FCB8FE
MKTHLHRNSKGVQPCSTSWPKDMQSGYSAARRQHGAFLPPARLDHGVAYVGRDWHMWLDMRVRLRTLLASLLQETGGPARDAKARASKARIVIMTIHPPTYDTYDKSNHHIDGSGAVPQQAT